MRIRFLKNTNIRPEPNSLTAAPVGVVYAETILDVEDQVYQGPTKQGQTAWYRDLNGWYYWAGQTQVVQEGPKPKSTVGPQQWRLPVSNWHPNLPEGETRLVPMIDLSDLRPQQPSVQNIRGGLLVEEPLIDEARKPTPPPIPVRNRWTVPSQARYAWALHQHDIPSVWWADRGWTGKGVTIAVLSTGCTLHHSDTPSALAADISPDMEDVHGAGTQAAIIAAGRGYEVLGVAPEANLQIVKVGQQDWLITPESVAAALQALVETKPDIVAILVDWKTLHGQQQAILEDSIQALAAGGTWLVAPVGNATERHPVKCYPASLPGVLSVGAHNEEGLRCLFSAKSHYIDVMCPGEGLWTIAAADGQVVENKKDVSMAAAYMAGFLALVRQAKPQLSFTDLQTCLHTTAARKGGGLQDYSVEYGYGLLHPASVLAWLEQEI